MTLAVLCGGVLALRGEASKQPPSLEVSAREPVKYVGQAQTDKRFYDGSLPHAVGVHACQAFRANRTQPPEGGLLGWTYNHQPMLAYWSNCFWLLYLSNPVGEHMPPGRTLLMHSTNGRDWTPPQVLFPIYALPEIKREGVNIPEGTQAIMHQRMGFYVAPGGRLLALGFYGYSAVPWEGPNNGNGLGRVVREVHPDASPGPIYFIRYNRHAGWNEANTRFPFYKTSADAGLVEACDRLLANKLMTLQWWEEDRADDGFYTIKPGNIPPKAPSYYHRTDGVVVALWKSQLAALSADEGQTWTPLVQCPTLMDCGAKTWGQRTEDGRFAIVYNHSATRRNRYPLVVMTSDDGRAFDNMFSVHGEVPPMRFRGLYKNYGPQYIRGIEEGNGNPPGRHLWLTYSMNKEDLWVTRCRLPVTAEVAQHVDENFDQVKDAAELELWNLYQPQWAPISIGADPVDGKNRCLELYDEDPYDYALAERVIPESRKVTLAFRIFLAQVGPAMLECEVQDREGRRPLRLRFDADWLWFDHFGLSPKPVPFNAGAWHQVALRVDCERQSYEVSLDGKLVRQSIEFGEKVAAVQRIVFRTGPWRGDVRAAFVDREPDTTGLETSDLPGSDQRVAPGRFLLDDIRSGDL